jgi:hypothetical protein
MNFVRDFADGANGRAGKRILRRLLLVIGAVVVGLAAFLAFLWVFAPVHARDIGWDDTPPNIRQWFQSLMQPDNPVMSCCGEADAYEADNFDVEGDHYVAIITDTRGDTFRNGSFRPHIDPGTRISIPNQKMKLDKGNPTIHGYVFIGSNGQLYCYVAPGGV